LPKCPLGIANVFIVEAAGERDCFFNLYARGLNHLYIPGGQFTVKLLGQACFVVPKLTRILLVIVNVNECGTNWLQKILLQEDMHQVACINTLILIAVWHVLRKNSKTSYFQLRGCYVGETRK
jgi:hypothetical protein